MNKNKPFIIVVVGPTASGKTALGVKLALELNGEIVSADSMQIYKGMDIATAKPSIEEMQGVKHHLIDFLDRDTIFSVADYVKLANEKIKDILNRGKQPIIVGGTGLYINSLLDNVQFSESECDYDYRDKLMTFAKVYGNEALHNKLKEIDEQSALNIHPNNLVRVIRALELYHSTGRTFSEHKAESRLVESPYNSLIFGLNYDDRNILYDKINKRVDIMIENGLIDEARNLFLESGKMKTASNAIGYKELIPYFENQCDLQTCIDKIKQETRRYAKRQLTWFRRNEQINWVILDGIYENVKIYEKCKKCIAKYENI